MADNTGETVYPVFKGLQKPLEFMGIQGRYIYWAGGAVGGAIVGFIIGYCFFGFVTGLMTLVAVVGVGAALITLKQRKGLHTKKEDRGVFVYTQSKRLLSIAVFFVIVSSGCSGKSERSEDAMAARQVVEKARTEWERQLKPIEIRVVDRNQEELADIGSIAVWVGRSDADGGDGDVDYGFATEFRYDGQSFKPATTLLADSSVTVVAAYPYRENALTTDTLMLSFPHGPLMAGIMQSIENKQDKIMINIELEELSAKLRLRLQSDNLGDMLTCVSVDGIGSMQKLEMLNGLAIMHCNREQMLLISGDCRLNNGMAHDFDVLPSEEAMDVTIAVTVNHKVYAISTTLPPLRPGSITELRLTLKDGKLSIGSSWVDTKHPFKKPADRAKLTVKPGMVLQKDGTIVEAVDSNSIALVVEVDDAGKHGKAVALADSRRADLFSGKEFRTGRQFKTVDGANSEGCFNAAMRQERDTLIRFSPEVNYSRKAALSERDGVALTQNMLKQSADSTRKAFADMAQLGTAYVPSVHELVTLAYGIKAHPERVPMAFKMPEGYYMTSCESGEDTFYSVDLQQMRVSAYNSKRYPNTKLRLFYLF